MNSEEVNGPTYKATSAGFHPKLTFQGKDC